MKKIYLLILVSMILVKVNALTDTIVIMNNAPKINLIDSNETLKIQLLKEKPKQGVYDKYGTQLVTILIFLLGFWRISYVSKKNTEKILFSKKLDRAEDFLKYFVEYMLTLNNKINSSTLAILKETDYISKEHHKLSLMVLSMLNSKNLAENTLINLINSLKENLDPSDYQIWKEKVFLQGKEVYNIKSK